MYGRELQVAIDAVRKAGTVAQSIHRTLVQGANSDIAISKDDKSPVTIADFAAQAIVNHTLVE